MYISETSNHYKFFKHLQAGGAVFFKNSLAPVRKLITIDSLDGDASKIGRFGYTNLTEVKSGMTMQHDEYGVVQIKFSADIGWHYLRFGYASFGTDFENVSPRNPTEEGVRNGVR